MAADGGTRRRGLSTAAIVLVCTLIGLVITISASWIALTLDRHNENRLLEVQTLQAAAVINAAVVNISAPLQTGLEVALSTSGSPTQVSRTLAAFTGPKKIFVSASLWKASGTDVQQVARVGVPPELAPSSPEAAAFVSRALRSTTFIVTSIRVGALQRIGYAVANPADPRFVIYAERSIPADRRVPVERGSAFTDLHFATYLGNGTGASNLATTDLPADRLPIKGHTARAVVPFGDTYITLIAAPRGHLGGALAYHLPWIFFLSGLLLTIAITVAAGQLVGQRRAVERDARTISGLYAEVDGLYREQRSIAETLQRAMLPSSNPVLPNLEIASRYVAGADGVDVGGDWYSVMAVGDSHFAFAVGDVSGRGLSAATIMARLRFTMRAYLLEGHAPELVLRMCSEQLDLERDGHFATAIIGIGDLNSREITLANAGHLPPLIICESGSDSAPTKVGVPLGVMASEYEPQTLFMPPGSTLVCFTDGLVERRGESLDTGLARLARAATVPAKTVESLLTGLLSALDCEDSEDDIAMLAFRWQQPDPVGVS